MFFRVENIECVARWLIIISLYVSTLEASAQNDKNRDRGYSVDINIFNLYDDHKIDTTYMGNREAFDMLDSYIRDTAIVNHTQIISVISSSSIEGRESYNNALSRRRMRAIESVFRQRYDHISADKWDFSYTAENWVYLRKACLKM
ncbi:MAG: hypothetical protein R3Y04_07485 [Rikenellaceae bacterium]